MSVEDTRLTPPELLSREIAKRNLPHRGGWCLKDASTDTLIDHMIAELEEVRKAIQRRDQARMMSFSPRDQFTEIEVEMSVGEELGDSLACFYTLLDREHWTFADVSKIAMHKKRLRFIGADKIVLPYASER